MQAVQMRRPGVAALLLLAVLAVAGCGQKGPLYRELPPEVLQEAQPASDDRGQSEQPEP